MIRKRYILSFPAASIHEPVTYNLIKKYDIRVNILNAYISSEEGGKLALEMESAAQNIKQALGYLKQLDVECVPLEKKIRFGKDKCIHCGACTAVCFPGALKLETNTRELLFDTEKCVVCELCTQACPLQLFEIDFVN